MIRKLIKIIFLILNKVLATISLEIKRKKQVNPLPSAISDGMSPSQGINISVEMMSRMFWERVFSDSEFWIHNKRFVFFKQLSELDDLRGGADYKTGSISSASAWCLYCLSRFFAPENVLEVGTFIGKSTTAIMMGMEDGGVTNGSIHTCDFSNEISLPAVSKIKIVQYKKTSSLDMLRSLTGKNSFSFFHIDGRVGDQDLILMDKLSTADAIIALDDFEGVEKGVANYMMFRGSSIFTTHTLIYPCETSAITEVGLTGRSTTAVLFPKRLIRLTNQ